MFRSSAEAVVLIEYLHAVEVEFAASSESIKSEGRGMLRAAAEDLASARQRVIVLLCPSAQATWQPIFNVETRVFPGDTVAQLSDHAARTCHESETKDVLLIAPETAGLLSQTVTGCRAAGLNVWAPSDEVIAVCSDKWQTRDWLKACGLPTIDTQPLTEWKPVNGIDDWVTKPNDGCGCEGITRLPTASVLNRQRETSAANELTLVQPFVAGGAFSIAAIGHVDQPAHVFPVLHQKIEWSPARDSSGQQAHYHGGELATDLSDAEKQAAAELATTIAGRLPLDVGYLGIDLLLTKDGWVITELNPRLCTGYLTYRSAQS